MLMNRQRLNTFLLLAIAVFLGMLAFRPLWTPEVTHADASDALPFYIEPGSTMLRSPDASQQVQGKVVIDMRNGNVWGFPTLSSSPYPVDTTSTQPPTSHPLYLGKFDFQRAMGSR
jgi:hypothetical protein